MDARPGDLGDGAVTASFPFPVGTRCARPHLFPPTVRPTRSPPVPTATPSLRRRNQFHGIEIRAMASKLPGQVYVAYATRTWLGHWRRFFGERRAVRRPEVVHLRARDAREGRMPLVFLRCRTSSGLGSKDGEHTNRPAEANCTASTTWQCAAVLTTGKSL